MLIPGLLIFLLGLCVTNIMSIIESSTDTVKLIASDILALKQDTHFGYGPLTFRAYNFQPEDGDYFAMIHIQVSVKVLKTTIKIGVDLCIYVFGHLICLSNKSFQTLWEGWVTYLCTISIFPTFPVMNKTVDSFLCVFYTLNLI